jgi:hypothetical protein
MKDQRPLRYRNSLVGGKYTKKKYTPWDFSFSYSSLVMEEPAPVQQDCEVRVLGAPCQIRTGGGLSEPPCFYKRTQEKKITLSLAI